MFVWPAQVVFGKGFCSYLYYHIFKILSACYCVDLDNIESFEVDTGFTQRGWAVTTSIFSLDGPDSEILLSSPANDTTTVTNFLPYTLNTSPNTSYRIQGFWRPYFNGWYNFSVNCDLQYELIVEQDDRTVKFCNGTEIWYVIDTESKLDIYGFMWKRVSTIFQKSVRFPPTGKVDSVG